MFFNSIELAPPDPFFGLQEAFLADERKNKIFLGLGVYQNEKGEKKPLECIQKAHEEIKEGQATYLGIDGSPIFIEEMKKLVFGESETALARSLIYGAQTVGGTSAVRFIGELLYQEVGKIVYLPEPTWMNHRAILNRVGFETRPYPYLYETDHRVAFDEMVGFLETLPPHSIVLLHPCCHNPTGVDLSYEQWKELSSLFLKKGLFPFFDFAYQGLGVGIEEDAAAIRLFAQTGQEMAVAASCSKNFSLYQQRTGALFIVSKDPVTAKRVGSQIKQFIRFSYSSPPGYGAHLVTHILTHKALRSLWEREVSFMRQRIEQARRHLAQRLSEEGLGRDFSFLSRGKGMFSLCGMGDKETERLQKEFAIYLPRNGRINFAGITGENSGEIVRAFSEVFQGK